MVMVPANQWERIAAVVREAVWVEQQSDPNDWIVLLNDLEVAVAALTPDDIEAVGK
jgi:hypothetical protein